MKLFDPKIYALHQVRAQKEFQNHNFLYNYVGEELTSRLQDIERKFNKALNLSPHSLSYPSFHHPSLEERLPFSAGSFDLILSCLQSHWVNDLTGLLKTIQSCLCPKGLFLGALWGGNTLHELRESILSAELSLKGGASPRLAPMLHPSDAPLLLGRAGFLLPVVDTESITVTYPSLLALMRDLRGMGETNKLYDRPKAFTSRTLFEKTEQLYRESFGRKDQTIPATFEVIYLTGWGA
jgi:NADH dehydrogenase [ubiquinone] 1 alpha subcomplex assembly factor 5